jgi:hypothetical protein
MALIVLLLISVVLATTIVWLADWTSDARRYTALAALNRRLAGGLAEYEEKRRLIGR